MKVIRPCPRCGGERIRVRDGHSTRQSCPPCEAEVKRDYYQQGTTTGTQIYALLDASGAIRYIGKTKRPPSSRLSLHWSNRYSAHNWNIPLRHWLRSLDERPAIRILAIVEDSAVERHPRAWNMELAIIRAAKTRWPDQILNMQDGLYYPVNRPERPRRSATVSSTLNMRTIASMPESPALRKAKP